MSIETPTRRSWRAMLRRCQVTKSPDYPDYGGRGIKVCERWQVYENFLADMGERPAGTSIGRKDNDGHYEPSNCRWETPLQNHNNKRSTLYIEHAGRRLSAAQWERERGLPAGRISHRLRAGWSPERAINEPVSELRRRCARRAA